MKKSFLKTIFYTVLITVLMVPDLVFGQEFKPLVGVPGVDANAQGIEPYINALFILAIALAAILAVIRIILSGAKYMFSEVVPAKGEAKKEIIGAVLGLLLILGGVTILNEINPNLTSFNALRDAKPVNVEGSGSSSNAQRVSIGGWPKSTTQTNESGLRNECTEAGGIPASTAQGLAGVQVNCYQQ